MCTGASTAGLGVFGVDGDGMLAHAMNSMPVPSLCKLPVNPVAGKVARQPTTAVYYHGALQVAAGVLQVEAFHSFSLTTWFSKYRQTLQGGNQMPFLATAVAH